MKETILIVDDDEVSRLVLKRCFCEYNTIEACSGMSALKIIESNYENIDVIVCDIVMPNMTGVELLKKLAVNINYQDIPFIVVTNYLENQLEALELGAWDYITKDTDKNIIISRVKNALLKSKLIETRKESLLKDKMFNLFTNLSNDFAFEWDFESDTVFYCGNYHDYYSDIIGHCNFSETIRNGLLVYEEDLDIFDDTIKKIGRKDNRAEIDLRIMYNHGIYWCKASFAATFHDGEIKSITCLLTNIDTYKQRIISAVNSSEHDPLTGLMNRKKFKENAIKLIEEKEENLAFVFIDIDNFKKANDTFGHLVGDEILIDIGERLKKSFIDGDYVARVGGDEFFILLTGISSNAELKERLDILMDNIRQPIELANGQTQVYTVSVGACLIKNKNTASYKRIYEIADKACYISKNNGKNQYTVVDW